MRRTGTTWSRFTTSWVVWVHTIATMSGLRCALTSIVGCSSPHVLSVITMRADLNGVNRHLVRRIVGAQYAL